MEALAREVHEEQLAALRRISEIGLAILEDIGQQSAESAGRSPGADHVELRAMKAAAIDLAFGRVTRAVRLTHALQNVTLEHLRRIEEIEAGNAVAAASDRAAVSQARERTVRSVLTRIIHDEAFGPEGADDDTDDGEDRSDERDRETCERLIGEAAECLKDHDRFGDLSGRPTSAIIALICKDLGIDPNWLSLSEESWAQEEIRSGLVGEALKKVSLPLDGGGAGVGVTTADPTPAAPKASAAPPPPYPPPSRGREVSPQPIG